MTATSIAAVPPLSETARWLRALGSLRGKAPAFDLTQLPADPAALFLDWLGEAVRLGVAEPHAATLATVGADDIPDARTLLLKDVSAQGWAVAGSQTSAKALQLQLQPAAALNFWWQPIVRAVRIRGSVCAATREQVLSDFAARPTRTASTQVDWMMWWVRPIRVEFWQGSPSRDHTRLVYELARGTWSHRILNYAANQTQKGEEVE